MVPASIELQRARRLLRTFCEQRGRGYDRNPEWKLFEDGNRFEVSVQGSAVLRLRFDEGIWHLYVPRADGDWMAYPPRPRTDSFDTVMAELEQAPLHVHW